MGNVEQRCSEFGEELFFCVDDPDTSVLQFIPYCRALVFPLDEQFKVRLDGLYLQDVIDTSLFPQQYKMAVRYLQ